MFKKIAVPISMAIILALVAGAWVTADAFAKDNKIKDRLRAAKKGLGQVTAIADQQFTIQKLNDQEITFLVDENTRFLTRSKVELEIGDLQVDQWVIAAGAQNENGERVARLVIILPAEFDPTQLAGAKGSITEVDLDTLSFSLLNRQGKTTTYDVNDETRFSGGVHGLSELKTGMRTWVAAKKQDDGNSLALAVRANFPVEKYRGEITGVDLSESSFTIHIRRSDQDLTFQVNETTKFKGKGDSVGSLHDLQPGMLTLVIVRPGSTESEQLVAQIVGVMKKDQ